MASIVFDFPLKFVIICLSLVWKRQKAKRWIGSRPSRKFNHWTYHWFRRSSQLTLQLRISGRAGNWIYFLKLRSDRGPKGRGSESLHNFSKIILVLSVRFLERTLSWAHAIGIHCFLVKPPLRPNLARFRWTSGHWTIWWVRGCLVIRPNALQFHTR